MTKGCYTCRRRRIVCDNEFPACRKCRNAGKECLGYQKPLVWVKGGVASRGKMMGLSFDDVACQGSFRSEDNSQLQTNWPSKLEDSSGSWTDENQLSCRNGAPVLPQKHRTEPLMYSLVDPLFQDLDKTSRFYIDIFNRNCAHFCALYDTVKNPYRELLPYINDSTLLADSLASVGAIQYAYMSKSDNSIPFVDGEIAQTEMALTKPHDSQAYSYFLRSKQRALQQLSIEVSHPVTRIDDRAIAAIFVLILLDMMESGNTAWMHHLEGAKNILRTRLSNGHDLLSSTDGISSFVVDACLITEIMGSTLARPGVLSKPFYSANMGAAMLKRLEKTAWVGCPAYLLDVIFFVHAQRYSEPSQTAQYSLSFLSPSAEATQAESPLAVLILRHIEAFDPHAWAEEMQSYLKLPDLSRRIAVAHAYKAAVYLYAKRVLTKWNSFSSSSDSALSLDGPECSLQSRKEVEIKLIQNLSLIPPEDEHFKCLIWPTFIAGAESTSHLQRATTLRVLASLWKGVYSFNLQNAAFVLKVMWEKQDERQKKMQEAAATAGGLASDREYDEADEEGFDWIQELDQSSTDWLFI